MRTLLGYLAPLMGGFDDLPIIQCRPGPSDAELQAQSDVQHARDVAAWGYGLSCAPTSWTVPAVETVDDAELDHVPARAVRG